MNHIIQAHRYLSTARELLARKVRRSGPFYTNRTCVRRVGKMAWEGVLHAVEGTFQVDDTLTRSHPSFIKAYIQLISQHSEAMAMLFANTFDTLYYTVGGDGNLSPVVVEVGLTQADAFIHWCAALSTARNQPASGLSEQAVKTNG